MTNYDPDQMAHSEAIFMLREGLKHGEISEKYEPAIERCREAFGETLMEALNDIPPEKRAGKYRPTHSDAEDDGRGEGWWSEVLDIVESFAPLSPNRGESLDYREVGYQVRELVADYTRDTDPPTHSDAEDDGRGEQGTPEQNGRTWYQRTVDWLYSMASGLDTAGASSDAAFFESCHEKASQGGWVQATEALEEVVERYEGTGNEGIVTKAKQLLDRPTHSDAEDGGRGEGWDPRLRRCANCGHLEYNHGGGFGPSTCDNFRPTHSDADPELNHDAEDVREQSDEELVDALESLVRNFCLEAGLGYAPVNLAGLEIKRRLQNRSDADPSGADRAYESQRIAEDDGMAHDALRGASDIEIANLLDDTHEVASPAITREAARRLRRTEDAGEEGEGIDDG